jgi:hypothetical protein
MYASFSHDRHQGHRRIAVLEADRPPGNILDLPARSRFGEGGALPLTDLTWGGKKHIKQRFSGSVRNCPGNPIDRKSIHFGDFFINYCQKFAIGVALIQNPSLTPLARFLDLLFWKRADFLRLAAPYELTKTSLRFYLQYVHSSTTRYFH